jgi:hypothetical protein
MDGPTNSFQTRNTLSCLPGSRPISTSIQEDNPMRYCRAMVQKHDYESFLTSSAYGKHTRDAYFALKALNVSSIAVEGIKMQISNDGFGQTELAMIPDNISQPIIAQMRFQWWKEAVKAVYQVRFRCAFCSRGRLIRPRAVRRSSPLYWLCMNVRSQSEYRNTICRGLSMRG